MDYTKLQKLEDSVLILMILLLFGGIAYRLLWDVFIGVAMVMALYIGIGTIYVLHCIDKKERLKDDV